MNLIINPSSPSPPSSSIEFSVSWKWVVSWTHLSLASSTASLMWRLGAGMTSITSHSVRWLMTMPRQSGPTLHWNKDSCTSKTDCHNIWGLHHLLLTINCIYGNYYVLSLLIIVLLYYHRYITNILIAFRENNNWMMTYNLCILGAVTLIRIQSSVRSSGHASNLYWSKFKDLCTVDPLHVIIVWNPHQYC